MAQPTNTFDTYDAVGIREDLQDVIYSIGVACVFALFVTNALVYTVAPSTYLK